MFRDAGPPCRLCPMPLAVPTRYVVDGVAGNQAPAPNGGSWVTASARAGPSRAPTIHSRMMASRA